MALATHYVLPIPVNTGASFLRDFSSRSFQLNAARLLSDPIVARGALLHFTVALFTLKEEEKKGKE